MKKVVARPAVCAAALLMGAACTTEDETDVDAGVNGGSGGSSSDAGSSGSGGSAGSDGNPAGGSGGSGGSMDADVPEAGTERFEAVLEGDTVRLTALDPVWVYTCNVPNPRLVQQAGNAWTLLRDDRPSASNLLHAAHYLDGSYRSDCALSAGCDVITCQSLAEFVEDVGAFQSRLTAREYLQVGELAAPACDPDDAGIAPDAGSDAGARAVPSIETRLPQTALAVRFRYFRDSACQSEEITVDIPVE